jgi:hypothetical protein
MVAKKDSAPPIGQILQRSLRVLAGKGALALLPDRGHDAVVPCEIGDLRLEQRHLSPQQCVLATLLIGGVVGGGTGRRNFPRYARCSPW